VHGIEGTTMLDEVKGFSCGWSGGSGGTLSGFQRSARRRGVPEPTKITGRKGQGRADRLRICTITVKRLSDGKTLERSSEPGYHSRKEWKATALALQKDLIKELS
jgi:hypothetical protein